jgi:geranylgeranyl pyrophosphate synthase
MSSRDGLSLCAGTEPLGLLIGNELEQRWSGGADLMDTICHYSLVPAGKLFRPILLLDSASAVGGDVQKVLPAAVGAECGHVASLIHDDIIDGDDLRRGRPSVHHKYGVSEAIVAGDALIFDLFAALAECRLRGVPDSRVAAALESVARAGIDLCRGQSLESELTANPRFDAAAYLTVARLKTASFFRGACESGAILGGGTLEYIEALSVYGESLGTAFQIHDDLLGYMSDTKTMGKPETSDIENGRLTLPVILAYEKASPRERKVISDALFSPADLTRRFAALTEVMGRTGAVAATVEMARDYAGESKRALEKLPPSQSRDRLMCFAEAVISRDC